MEMLSFPRFLNGNAAASRSCAQVGSFGSNLGYGLEKIKFRFACLLPSLLCGSDMPLYIAPCFLYPGSLTGCTGRVKYAGLHLQLKCVFLQDGKMPENGEKPRSFVDGAELAKILDNAQEAVEVTVVERL